jgi:two-component system alkaline phosphatase synthesis response regulator PhoP
MNGLDFLHTIRQKPELSGVSVFILSTKETETDEIISLEVGADDYIIKPVQTSRFIARIRALFRRQDQQIQRQDSEDDVITIDDLSILISQYTVVYGKELVGFSKKEFEILVQLAKNQGRVVTRQVLFHTIWGHQDISANRTIDVHIGRIRKKLKGYAHYIETVSGIGYRFHE